MHISQLLTDELKVRDAYRDGRWPQEGGQRKQGTNMVGLCSCADLPSASSKRQNTNGAAKEQNAFSKAEYNYPKWTAAKELEEGYTVIKSENKYQ